VAMSISQRRDVEQLWLYVLMCISDGLTSFGCWQLHTTSKICVDSIEKKTTSDCSVLRRLTSGAARPLQIEMRWKLQYWCYIYHVPVQGL